MKPMGYFVLGFIAAAILALIGLAVLNGQLFHVFSSFSGR